MRRPIIIGMGPSGKFPTQPWSDHVSTTMMLTWLSIGEWASPRLGKTYQLEDLSENHTKVFNRGTKKYEDGIDEGSARAKIRHLVGLLALTEGRDVLLLGKKVRAFFAKELNNEKLNNSQPYFQCRVMGRFAGLNPDNSEYDFTAHMLWHPRRVFESVHGPKKKTSKVEPLTPSQVQKFRDVLRDCAQLPISDLPPVEKFLNGTIKMPQYPTRRGVEMPDEHDEPTFTEIDSDREDWSHSTDDGWFYTDED